MVLYEIGITTNEDISEDDLVLNGNEVEEEYIDEGNLKYLNMDIEPDEELSD